MDINYVLCKLENLTGLNCFDRYKDDISKLVDAHNEKRLCLYPRLKILSEQIMLGLDNPYNRIVELLKYPKDSSSLEVFKIKYGDLEGIKRYKKKNDKTKQTEEKYIKKYGEIDGPIKYREYCKSKSMSLEMCIKRYGEVEGPIIFRNYWDTTGFGTTKRAFKKRHGDDWEKYYKEFCTSQGKSNSLSGKILKYGKEDGTIKYKELNMKKSKSLSKESFVKNLLDSGASFSDIQNAISERWSNTSIKSFISRYGEVEGHIKYQEFIKKVKEENLLCLEYYEKRNIPNDVAFEIISKIQWERNSKISRHSKESLKYLDKLYVIFTDRGYHSQYKENEFGICLTYNEYNLHKKNRMFFYDFYVPDLKLIIEYHGERFHDDIDYDSTINVDIYKLKNAEYNKDFYKKWIAEQRDFNVIILRSWKINDDLNKMFEILNFSEDEKCKFL